MLAWGDSFSWQCVCCVRMRTWVGAPAPMCKSLSLASEIPAPEGNRTILEVLLASRLVQQETLPQKKKKVEKGLWNAPGIDL